MVVVTVAILVVRGVTGDDRLHPARCRPLVAPPHRPPPAAPRPPPPCDRVGFRSCVVAVLELRAFVVRCLCIGSLVSPTLARSTRHTVLVSGNHSARRSRPRGSFTATRRRPLESRMVASTSSRTLCYSQVAFRRECSVPSHLISFIHPRRPSPKTPEFFFKIEIATKEHDARGRGGVQLHQPF